MSHVCLRPQHLSLSFGDSAFPEQQGASGGQALGVIDNASSESVEIRGHTSDVTLVALALLELESRRTVGGGLLLPPTVMLLAGLRTGPDLTGPSSGP